MVEAKIASTLILISKDNKALILQYTDKHKILPNMWTVPGGKVEESDGRVLSYLQSKWNLRYYAGEDAAIREISEEANIFSGYNQPKLLCSIYAKESNIFILSYIAKSCYSSEEIKVKINPLEHSQFKWISRDEVEDYNFVADIRWELYKAFDQGD